MSEAAAFDGQLPAGRLWAFVEYRTSGRSYRWRDVQTFRAETLPIGLVLADDRRMTVEEFYGRDTCNPPRDYEPPAQRLINRHPVPVGIVGGGLLLVVAALVFGDLRQMWRVRRSRS